MRRRAFLSTLAAGGTVFSAGCMGGKVVFSKNRTVNVPPERGAIFELPAEGEKIKYIARDDRPFDVYVFKSRGDYAQYKAYIDGESPERTPPGDGSLSKRALNISGDLYEATTKNRGRQPLKTDGPSYFVLDNSNYRGETTVGEQANRLTVALDLEVVKSNLPI